LFVAQFDLSAQVFCLVSVYTGLTWAEDTATQGCDRSADSAAGMRATLGSPFVRLMCNSVSGEASIGLAEELQLVEQANAISSFKKSITDESLSLIFVVDAGFHLNHNNGNLTFILTVQDGTAG
jgi:hypothetical protein